MKQLIIFHLRAAPKRNEILGSLLSFDMNKLSCFLLEHELTVRFFIYIYCLFKLPRI